MDCGCDFFFNPSVRNVVENSMEGSGTLCHDDDDWTVDGMREKAGARMRGTRNSGRMPKKDCAHRGSNPGPKLGKLIC